MIQIGLTGWGDHPDLYQGNAKQKLQDYSAHFPIVELDAMFYAVQPKRNNDKWIEETPKDFQFIVKTYQQLTGHLRGDSPFDSLKDAFEAYRLALSSYQEAGKLGAVLAQYPPWFDCTKENVDVLRQLRDELAGFDVAIEFRHQSWYEERFRDKTFEFLREHDFIHSICDEPQSGEGSIPLVPEVTAEKALFRFHGRNVAAWQAPVTRKNWREIRYLYDYNKAELEELAKVVQQVDAQAEQTMVLFNNNSGGHAAKNAKQLQQRLAVSFEGLAPKQLDLFGGDM